MRPRPKKVEEERRPNVPAYIVTFSDMVTLLLTFFVMLLTLAQVQDPELMNKGRDSFSQSIRKFGLGALFGRTTTPNFGSTKIKYAINSPDAEEHGRTIDAIEEDIRRIFKKVDRTVKTRPSEIVSKKTNFSVTNVRFPLDQISLSESSKQFLTQFVENLKQNAESGAIKLYVLGLATDEITGKKQWITSALRAQAVEAFLSNTIPKKLHWPVYSWGAATGGDWVKTDSHIYEGSHILIGILRQDE